MHGLIPFSGWKLSHTHGNPKGEFDNADLNSGFSSCVQTMTSWGCTQAKANLVTPFVPGTPTAMKISTAYSIREAAPTGEPWQPPVSHPHQFYSFPKCCCSRQVWPVGPWVGLLQGRLVRMLFHGNLGNRHKLNMLSPPERTLAPRNSLTLTKTWQVQRHEHFRGGRSLTWKKRRNRDYCGLEDRTEVRG